MICIISFLLCKNSIKSLDMGQDFIYYRVSFSWVNKHASYIVVVILEEEYLRVLHWDLRLSKRTVSL